MNCLICNLKLTGRQVRFCSRRCGKVDWKRRNPDKMRGYVQAYKFRSKAAWFVYLQELKKSTPCADCKVQYHPHAMDFDHVRGPKIRNVSQYNSFASLEEIKLEIAKCEIVCSNCHRMRTLARRPSNFVET